AGREAHRQPTAGGLCRRGGPMRVERLMSCGAAALLAAGCADRPEPVEAGVVELDDPGMAMLGGVHADPSAGELAVDRGYAEASAGLGYLDDTDWVSVAAGDGTLSIMRTADAGGEPAAESDAELEPGGHYTLVAYDDG